MVNEDDLRAALASQQLVELDVEDLRRAIDAEAARRRKRRTALWTSGLAALIALVMGVPTAIWLEVKPATLAGLATRPMADGILPTGPLNLLLLGIDPYDPGHSDTIMIVHLPGSGASSGGARADGARVDLVSIERDVFTEVPGHGTVKINTAFSYGGADLARRTVESLTGVHFNGTVVVHLDAVEKITDSLGGVDICLEHPVTSIHTGRVYPTGCQAVDGAMATDLLRQRRDQPLGAYDRDRNAQRFLAALAAKVTKLNLITDLAKVSRLLATGGLTIDLSGITLQQLLQRFRATRASDLVGIGVPEFQPTIEDGQAGELLPKDAAQLYADIRADTVAAFVATHPTWVTQLRTG
jgi:LCP family protein required for cell wall assembly